MSENGRWEDSDGPIVIDREKEKEKQKVKPPPKYKVVMLNDDFTQMDFVVLVLQRYFQKGLDEATLIMLDVHSKGKGVAGVYSKDIAETKMTVVNNTAQSEGHPFRCEIEPE